VIGIAVGTLRAVVSIEVVNFSSGKQSNGVMMSACESMPLPLPRSTPPSVRWFSAYGCVAGGEGEFEVWLGGTLVGRFGAGDRGVRNAILVGLAGDPKMHLGALADAFGISSEALRQVRRAYEDGGLEAIVSQARGGRQPKVTAPLLRSWRSSSTTGRA
jgi:hypothetical protein